MYNSNITINTCSVSFKYLMDLDNNFGKGISGDATLNSHSSSLTFDIIKKQLSETSNLESLANVIHKILQSSNIYVFSEILNSPEIVAHENNEKFSPYIRLLELYAFGTYQDYLIEKNTFPQLNDLEVKKLKFLSVVDLSYKYKNIPYEVMKKELNIDTIRELEDLLIEIIYAGLIKGIINQSAQLFCIEYAMGRDVKLNSLTSLLKNLEKWYDNNNRLIMLIDNEICEANKKKRENFDTTEKYNENVESLKKLIKSSINIGNINSNPLNQPLSKVSQKYQNVQHDSFSSNILNNHYYPLSNQSQKSLHLNETNGFAMEEDEVVNAIIDTQSPSTSQSCVPSMAQSAHKQQASSPATSSSSSKKQLKSKSGLRGSAAKLFHKQ